MATEDIITRYLAEVEGYVREIEKIKASVRTLVTEEKKQTEESKKANVTLKQAATERKKLLEAEVNTLKKLKAESKLAFSPADIAKYNTAIAASQRNIDLLKGKISSIKGVNAELKGAFAGIGAGIAAAFSVAAIENFLKSASKTEAQFQSIQNAISFIQGSTEGGAKAMQFLTDTSQTLGLELQSTAQAFKLFSASAQLGGFTAKETKEVFESVATATTALGLSAEDAQGVFLALSQIVSKGTVAAEELRGQIGERLPGAFELAAKSMGLTTKAFNKLLSEGKIASNDFLPKFAATLKETFSGALPNAVNSTQANMNRLANLQTEFALIVGKMVNDSGFLKGVLEGFELFNASFRSEQTKQAQLQASQVATARKIVEEELKTQQELSKIRGENSKDIELLGKIRDDVQLKLDGEKKSLQDLTTEYKTNKEITYDSYQTNFTQIQNRIKALTAERFAVHDLIIEEGDAAKAKKKAQDAANDEAKIKSDEAAAAKRKKDLEDALKEEKRLRDEINKLKIDTAPDEETKLKLKAEIDAESFKKVEEDKRSFDAVIINIDKLRTEALRLNQEKLNQDLNDLYKKDFENAVKAGEAKADIDGADAKKELAERLRIERETQERINGEREDAEVKGSIAQLKIKRDNLEANRDEEIKNAERTITNEQDLANKKYQINKKYADDIDALNEQIAESNRQTLIKILNTTSEFVSIIGQYYQQQSDARIAAIQKQGDAQTEAFDKEMEGLQNLRDKKLISESTFEARSAEIKEQRVASEKRVEAAIAAEKRKSAQVAKTLAAFKASLALLVAIAEENYIGAAIAAVELAAILATPIPAFKHGTKGKKTSGTALVGEEGAEFVHLPQGAQVVPHKQTVKNKELVNAMIDDKVDYYIFKNYTLPELLKSGTIERPLQVRSAMSDSFVKTEKNKTILKIQIADDITKNFIGEIAKTYHQIIIKQQSENERQQQKNFNSVIKNAITSTVINNGNGMDEYAMARAINSSGMRIKNVREIGKAIASEIVNVNDYRHL